MLKLIYVWFQQKSSKQALFEELFGDFLDSKQSPMRADVAQSGPHQVSDLEMEVALHNDAKWEDVLPASEEGPPITQKAPEGECFGKR